MIVEYILNVALIVAVVSLITMFILVLLNTVIPSVLFWVFGISLLISGATKLYVRKT